MDNRAGVYVLWEKVGDGLPQIVGYAQKVAYNSVSDKLFIDIHNWTEAVKDHNGFPVKRYITPERFIQSVSDIGGLNQDG